MAAYWRPFEMDRSHSFRPGTRFGDVLNLYTFDRQLRLLILDAIERVEVSFRSAWSHQLARQYGPHAHLNDTIVRKADYWRKNLDEPAKEVNRSNEVFALHFREKYEEDFPPIWATCEIMSFGLLSRWYGNLQPTRVRQAIADHYQLDHETLKSWIHHLTVLRNTCAHHSRIWNREFTVIPQAPRSKPAGMASQWVTSSRKIYNSLLILQHFMTITTPAYDWRREVMQLMASYRIDGTAMGFPDHWPTLPIWQVPAGGPHFN